MKIKSKHLLLGAVLVMGLIGAYLLTRRQETATTSVSADTGSTISVSAAQAGDWRDYADRTWCHTSPNFVASGVTGSQGVEAKIASIKEQILTNITWKNSITSDAAANGVSFDIQLRLQAMHMMDGDGNWRRCG